MFETIVIVSILKRKVARHCLMFSVSWGLLGWLLVFFVGFFLKILA